MNILELEEAVNSIEQDIFESTGGVEYFNITVSTNGFVQLVEFAGLLLWSSEDDNRPYEDEYDETSRMPIEQHLRELLREELEKLSTIRV